MLEAHLYFYKLLGNKIKKMAEKVQSADHVMIMTQIYLAWNDNYVYCFYHIASIKTKINTKYSVN